MRFEWLFLRWVVVIGLATVGLKYLWRDRPAPDNSQYRKVLLLEGDRAFGTPLAGIAVDPERREVYGLLRGSAEKSGALDFFILWKGKDGQNYGATFSGEEKGMNSICQISPDGRMQRLPDPQIAGSATATDPAAAAPGRTPEEALRSILAALPPDPNWPGKR